jgi:RNA polymerase sigma-70 factor (ECF subfamily)
VDRKLISQAVTGDREALSRLLRQIEPMLRERLAGQIPASLASLMCIDDVIQETFTDAYLDIYDFDPSRGAFETWVTSIAKHSLLNAIESLRAEKRGGNRQRVDPSKNGTWLSFWQVLTASASTPSHTAMRSETRSLLAEAIEKLPGAHRTVVQLYDLERRPVEEVAGVLGRSPGAVFMLRSRAHRELRRHLSRSIAYLTGGT